MTRIPKEFLSSAFNTDKWAGRQPEFYSFRKKAIVQISKDNAYQVALGTEIKMIVPDEPVREMLADGVTPVLSDAAYGQIHSHYQFRDKKVEKHNENWEKRATCVFDVITNTLELTLLPKVSQYIMERNPSACWTAFLALGGLRNAAIAVSARNGLGNTVFTDCSITVIAACIEETYERVNENSTDPVSDAEKKAMLISKVSQMDTAGIFAFDIKTIALKVVPPVPTYDEVKTLLLTAESSHFQNMDPETIVKATFNSFGMKAKESKIANIAKSTNPIIDCPHCHQPGHVAEDCPRFVNCKNCKKVHSKYWKGCPDFSENKSKNNNSNNNNKNTNVNKDPKKQEKNVPHSNKRPFEEDPKKIKESGGSKKSYANAAKENPLAVDLAESMATLNESLLSLTSAVSTLSSQQAKTARDLEKNQIKTAKLATRFDQMDVSKSRTVDKQERKTRYQDQESSDESN